MKYTNSKWYVKKIFSDLKKIEYELGKLENSITVFGSARLSSENLYYKQAKTLSKSLADFGFNIVTGGASGIMEAANKGAFESSKSSSFGINIKLPFEQKGNDFTTKEATLEYLSIRKVALIRDALAFIVFPGGFGTMDELFEILVYMQTKIQRPRPIFLIGKDFWSGFNKFITTTLIEEKVISKKDIELFEITDDLEYVVEKIKPLMK